MTFNNVFLSLSNFIPEIFLFSMAMVVLLIGITNPLKKYVVSLTIVSTLIALFLCFWAYTEETVFMFNTSLVKDNKTEFFKILCYIIFLIQIIVSQKYLENKKLISGEFYSLLIFALIGCLIIIACCC